MTDLAGAAGRLPGSAAIARSAVRWFIPRPSSPTAPACTAARRERRGCWGKRSLPRGIPVPWDKRPEPGLRLLSRRDHDRGADPEPRQGKGEPALRGGDLERLLR